MLGGHCEQDELALTLEKRPWPHCVHCVTPCALDAEKVPATHMRQVLAPLADCQRPWSHALHALVPLESE